MDNNSEKTEATPLWRSTRLCIALVTFLGFTNLYMLRVNLSVSMVCMVNHTEVALMTSMYQNQTSPKTANIQSKDSCDSQDAGDGNSREDGEFVWESEKQGIILGSFFWGYTLTQIIGGWMATKFGAKRVYGYAMLVNAICTLLSPPGARLSEYCLMILRLIGGMCQGVVWPSTQVLWSYWAPPLETGKLAAFGYAGSQIGNVITFPFAALLCEYGFDGGWASIFYIFGVIGCIWFVLWMYFVSDTPQNHPRISEDEKSYIVSSIQHRQDDEKSEELKVPWLKIMTSRAVWAIFIAHTFANWGTYTFLTNTPKYMKQVLKFDIKKNGLLTALPYICFWLMCNISGWAFDFALTRRMITRNRARKIGTVIGEVGPAFFLLILSFMDCQSTSGAVILLTIGVGLSGWTYGAGFLNNPGDIAPKYAGVIFGISNTFASIPGFLAPTVIGYITKTGTREEWQVVFYIAIAIYVCGAVFYLIFSEADIQDWAVDKPIEIEVNSDTNMTNFQEAANSNHTERGDK